MSGQVGSYKILRLLGQVGPALLYEAEEALSRRRVALKMLTPERSLDERARAAFVAEIQAISRVDHPGLVRSLAAQEIDGQLVLVLESLEGKPLRRVLSERGALPWAEASAVLLQVASALDALHLAEPPALHGDLRPENLLSQPEGRIKLLEGPTARVLASEPDPTPPGLTSLRYTSPEQIEGKPLDPRSDLYQLGLLFFELLSGRGPFPGESPRELMEQQCSAVPSLPPEIQREIPRGVEALLMRLLAKAPGERPASAREVADTLESFLPSGSSLHAPAAPPRAPIVAASAAPAPLAVRPAAALVPAAPAALVPVRAAPKSWLDRDVPTPVALGIVATASLLAALLAAALRYFF
ncbi:MAG: serine/threonine protein kinase [Polyangiaceae bacterium]|nr:serine/threonine protein kinase [Polyangiaceae bacterium]